jgi:hypothetical protein
MFFIHKKTADLIPIPQNEQKVIKQLDDHSEEEQISVIKLLSLKKEYCSNVLAGTIQYLLFVLWPAIFILGVRNYSLTIWIAYLPKIELPYPLKNYGNIPIKKSKGTTLYKQNLSLSSNDRIISNKNTTNKSLTSLGQVLYTIIDDSKVNIVQLY